MAGLRMLRPFVVRPRLVISMLAGLLVSIALILVPNELSPSTRAILAWDVTCLTFIGSVIAMMWGANADKIRAKAATQDEGQGAILGLVILAVAASVMVVAAELSAAKGDVSWLKGVRIGLVFATVAASWFMVQLIFALHYAHEYYLPDEASKGKKDVGGLAFPGGEPPDYWDFVHFSVVIGVASQTADIAFTSKPLRRIGTIHGLVAFVFNTVVVALTINLLAGLF